MGAALSHRLAERGCAVAWLPVSAAAGPQSSVLVDHKITTLLAVRY